MLTVTLVGERAIAAGGGVEIEAGPAAAVVERHAGRQFGGGEDLVELAVAQIGKPRVAITWRPGGTTGGPVVSPTEAGRRSAAIGYRPDLPRVGRRR